jgi:hypothetical protein
MAQLPQMKAQQDQSQVPMAQLPQMKAQLDQSQVPMAQLQKMTPQLVKSGVPWGNQRNVAQTLNAVKLNVKNPVKKLRKVLRESALQFVQNLKNVTMIPLNKNETLNLFLCNSVFDH